MKKNSTPKVGTKNLHSFLRRPENCFWQQCWWFPHLCAVYMLWWLSIGASAPGTMQSGDPLGGVLIKWEMKLHRQVNLYLQLTIKAPPFTGKLNELFHLDNVSNSIHNFLYENFNKKILGIFFYFHTKIPVLNLMRFQNKIA